MYRRHLIFLLLLGGAIVALEYFVQSVFFDYGSQPGWRIANLFHLTGGAFAFFFARALYLSTWYKHRTKTEKWMELLIFIAGAIVLGVAWEWYELAVDRYRVLMRHLPSIMTYADNIGDLLLDALGACIAAYFFRKYGAGKRIWNMLHQ